MRRLGAVVVVVAMTSGFYLLLIDTVSLPELYAMAGIVLLAVAAFVISLQQDFTEAAVKPRWLLRIWRPIVSVPGHIVIVTRAALVQTVRPRGSRGVLRAVPFAGGEQPIDVGRRALSEAAGSLAPNTIVIGVDAERELLLVHQLHKHGSPGELDVLRLG